MRIRSGSLRMAGAVAGLAALALAGFALAALPRPTVTAISSAKGSRTLTISGTSFNRLRFVHVGGHGVRFNIVSPAEVIVTVPLAWQTVGASIKFTFRQITVNWGKKCSQCKDQWAPSG
jgi:hypothetical protein